MPVSISHSVSFGHTMSATEYRAASNSAREDGAGAVLRIVITPCRRASARAAADTPAGISSWHTTTRAREIIASDASTSATLSRSFAPFTTTIELFPSASTQMGATPVAAPAVVSTRLQSMPCER